MYLGKDRGLKGNADSEVSQERKSNRYNVRNGLKRVKASSIGIAEQDKDRCRRIAVSFIVKRYSSCLGTHVTF